MAAGVSRRMPYKIGGFSAGGCEGRLSARVFLCGVLSRLLFFSRTFLTVAWAQEAPGPVLPLVVWGRMDEDSTVIYASQRDNAT